MQINGNNTFINPLNNFQFNQNVNPGNVSNSQSASFSSAQQSPAQSLGNINGLLQQLIQGLQQAISTQSGSTGSTSQNLQLGNGQTGNVQVNSQPGSLQFSGQANGPNTTAQVNGQANSFQFGNTQPGNFQFGAGQPGNIQFGSGQPGNIQFGAGQPGNTTFQNNFSFQQNINQNNIQFTQQSAPQPIFFQQQPQQVFQQPQQQFTPQAPQQLFQQQAQQLFQLQQAEQQQFQQPQQVQQTQQTQQQEQPRGQGILAQILGPVGGTSSRLFGDIPVIGDILNVISPIALDLNGDGGIGVTGQSTAKDAQRTGLGQTVSMDLNADGQAEQVEWLKGDGDAMLVDNRDGQALSQGIDGTRLFGDEGGRFENGYQKLAQLDSNQDGQLVGQELQGLQAWIDNGDGVATASEMVDVTALGMSSMNVGMQNVSDAEGNNLMRSSANINGQNVMTEDVWFASKG